MSKELSIATSALRAFIERANAAFPGLPEVTLTFPTHEALIRFRVQMMADTDTMVRMGWRELPSGVEAEINGIRLRLKVRT